MGWDGAHLWDFSDKRRDGVIYELPHDDDGFPSFSKRLTIDASKVSLRSVLPGRGAKLYYEYTISATAGIMSSRGKRTPRRRKSPA